jgi:hypothetical protein
MKKKHKNNDFKTPEGYFDGLADRLLPRLKGEKARRPEGGGFVTPDSYFENLNKEVLKKVIPSETRVVGLRPYRKYYFAAASIAAVLLLFFGWQWNNSEDLTFGDLASADIEYYLESTELELTPYEIGEVLAIDELEVNDILDDQLNEENIIDYLDKNVDDFDELNLDTNE